MTLYINQVLYFIFINYKLQFYIYKCVESN